MRRSRQRDTPAACHRPFRTHFGQVPDFRPVQLPLFEELVAYRAHRVDACKDEGPQLVILPLEDLDKVGLSQLLRRSSALAMSLRK
jgi:hypothetical protein